MRKSSDPGQMTLLDLISPQTRTCERCGGTILPPTIGGVPRGTCHCSREPAPEKVVRSEPKECCKKVIAAYERDYPHAERAKAFGVASVNRGSRVALFCKTCEARLEFAGTWIREGGL